MFEILSAIFKIPETILLLWSSAAFFILAVIVFFPPLKKEKTVLMQSFFAFLAGMAFFHVFLGLGFFLNSLHLIHIGFLGALIGSAFVSRFPLSEIAPRAEKAGFIAFLVLALGIFGWMVFFPHGIALMNWLGFGYMIIVIGSAGFYMILKGFLLSNTDMKVKSVGGGLSVVTCCVVADLFVLFMGASFLSEFFMMLSPIILLFAIFLGRSFLQLQTNNS